MVAGYPESTAVSELKDIVMPTTNYEMDFDKQLAEVKQNYIELEVKGKGYDGEVTYLEPENGILKAGQFSVKVSEDIADEICYLSYEDSIDVYYKNDFTYEYDSDKMCITYWPARLGTIQGGADIGESIACIIPQWVIGDEAERKEVNEYIHTILKQVCTLAGKEYTYQNEIFVEEDGNVRGSDLLSLYTEYKDKLTVDGRVYYTFTPPSDPQIHFDENTEEFEAIRAYFRTLAEIVDGE